MAALFLCNVVLIIINVLYVNKQEFSASSWRSNQGYTKIHSQPTIKICNAKQARQIYQYKKIKTTLYKYSGAIWHNKTCRIKHLTPAYINIKKRSLINVLYVNKQELSASSWRSNQGYTKMHGEPTINNMYPYNMHQQDALFSINLFQ
jgi:hypothetical protein